MLKGLEPFFFSLYNNNMKISDIKWKMIKSIIGRWIACEVYAGQVKYELIADINTPFVITEFTVDFRDETVSEGWRDILNSIGEEVPLTPEERAEAEQMIADMKRLKEAEEYINNLNEETDLPFQTQAKNNKDPYDTSEVNIK